MTKTNKISLGIIIGLAVLIGVLLGSNYISKSFGANPVANDGGFTVNLIGSQVGTTTTAVAFYGTTGVTATSTYPIRIRPGTDKLTLKLLATEASSTGATINLSLLSSDDFDCNTATTSTIYDVATMNQIKWYDAASHIRELAGSTSINTGTTTISFTPLAGTGKEINLVDLNSECLALQISGSSTAVMVQFKTKIN
jgi:hypothetical protein